MLKKIKKLSLLLGATLVYVPGKVYGAEELRSSFFPSSTGTPPVIFLPTIQAQLPVNSGVFMGNTMFLLMVIVAIFSLIVFFLIGIMLICYSKYKKTESEDREILK